MEDYSNTDIVFPFKCVFVYEASGYTEEVEITKTKSLYFAFLFEIRGRF